MCCKLGTGAGVGVGVERITHRVTPRHSRQAAPLTQKPLPKKVRGMSHQLQLHPQQPGEGPKGHSGNIQDTGRVSYLPTRGGAGLPRISSADCVPALRKHML